MTHQCNTTKRTSATIMDIMSMRLSGALKVHHQAACQGYVSRKSAVQLAGRQAGAFLVGPVHIGVSPDVADACEDWMMFLCFDDDTAGGVGRIFKKE